MRVIDKGYGKKWCCTVCYLYHLWISLTSACKEMALINSKKIILY